MAITKEQAEQNQDVMRHATTIFESFAVRGSAPLNPDDSKALETIYQAALDRGEINVEGEALRGGFTTIDGYPKGKRITFKFTLYVDDVDETPK